jgi:class 3 adenylate cyclase
MAIETPPLERKLAAILAADVEGYSRLMHVDEERTLATLTTHRKIVDDLIAAGRGQISGTAGDSVLAEFASVIDAFCCAIAIQQALAPANAVLPDEARMLFRIGINVGDVMVKNDGIFGDGVNIAARVEALAEPGGICVTRGVRDHLRDRVDAEFEDLGEHSVKNIARSVRVFRALFDLEGTSSLPGGMTKEAPTTRPSGQSQPDDDSAEIAFWQSVEASDDEQEYRIYLDRYPNGTFAEIARSRLNGETSVERTGDDPSVELAFWETVKDSGSKEMIEAYLQKFPDGEFKALAEIMLTSLSPPA